MKGYICAALGHRVCSNLFQQEQEMDVPGILVPCSWSVYQAIQPHALCLPSRQVRARGQCKQKVKRFRSYVLYVPILCKALVKVLHLSRVTTVSQIQQWFLCLTQKNNTPATIAMNHTSSKSYQYTVVNFQCDDAFELSLQLLLKQ